MAALSTEKGSLILEVIVAIAVFGLIVGSLSGLLAGLQSETVNIQDHRQALYEAAGIIGRAMNAEATNKNFLSLISTPTTTFTEASTSPGDSTGLFTERLMVKDLTPCMKALTSFVSWPNNTELNAIDTISLSFVTTDPTEDQNLGGDCQGDSPKQSWTSAVAETVATEPLKITTLDANNGTLIAVSSSSDPTLFVFHYQKTDVPTQSGALSLDSPIASLDLANNYVYLAVASSTNQLKIVSVTNPTNPTIISSATLPNVAGSYPGGLSVFYYNARLYVGTHRTAGQEFHIYDVSSPQKPTWLGSIELNHNINQIVVRGKYAYLATSGNTDDIIILDVSNPAAIKQIASLTFAGSEDTISVFLMGNILYAGRKKGSSTSHPEFYAIDVTNPASPSIISSSSIGSTVASIRAASDLAFLATDNPAKTFMVENINDPTHISTLSYQGLNMPGTSLDYESDMVFIAASSSLTLFRPSA